MSKRVIAYENIAYEIAWREERIAELEKAYEQQLKNEKEEIENYDKLPFYKKWFTTRPYSDLVSCLTRPSAFTARSLEYIYDRVTALSKVKPGDYYIIE